MNSNIYSDDELKQLCKNTIDYNIEIKKLKEQIKIINDKKIKNESKILEKLDNYKEKYYNFSNYNFKKNINVSEGSIKPEYISDVLFTYVTDDSVKIKDLLKNIMDKRVKNEKTSLKIKEF